METNKNYNIVDLMKFVMALFVVTIHTSLYETIPDSLFKDIVAVCLYSAVPFFFIVSAFFVVGSMSKEQVYKYWKRILCLYFVWSLLNLFLTKILQQESIWSGIGSFSYRFVFCGYDHLWYLWGLLLVIPLLKGLIMCGGARPWMFLIIAICAFVFNRLYTHFGSMVNPSFYWQWCKTIYQSQLFGVTHFCLALTYLSLGTFLKTTDYNLKRWQSFILLFVGFWLVHIESHKEVSIGIPIIAFVLFSSILKVKVSASWISFKRIRKMSTLIYFIHVIVIVFTGLFLPKMTWLRWGLVEFLCVTIAYLFLFLSNIRCLKWLKIVM